MNFKQIVKVFSPNGTLYAICLASIVTGAYYMNLQESLAMILLFIIPVVWVVCARARRPVSEESQKEHYKIVFYAPLTTNTLMIWKSRYQPTIGKNGVVDFTDMKGFQIQLNGSYSITRVFPLEKRVVEKETSE